MFWQADKIILGFIYINGIEEVIVGIWVYLVVLGYFFYGLALSWFYEFDRLGFSLV